MGRHILGVWETCTESSSSASELAGRAPATHLPTLSAPRSGSDLRMWWKRSAGPLGGVFQHRRNSSACGEETIRRSVIFFDVRVAAAARGGTCFGRAERAGEGCDGHQGVDGAAAVPMDGGETLGGVGRPQTADDGLRRVVSGSEEGDVAAVCKATRRAKHR